MRSFRWFYQVFLLTLRVVEAFLSIDWQDFVVAGAITFTPEDDQTELPTPATVEQLRLRSMAEKRLAALPAVAPGAATTTASASAGDEQEEAEMDVDEDVSKPPPGEQAAEPSAPGSTAIKIRKDYVPKGTTDLVIIFTIR